MANVQKADPVARRKAIIIFIISALGGSLLILIFESYRAPIYDWLLSDDGDLAHRLRILIMLAAAFGALAPLAFSMYLWAFGCKVSNYRRFPLPGQKVIRDTPILERQAAMTRGSVLKISAVCLAVTGVMLCFVFGWLILKLEELV